MYWLVKSRSCTNFSSVPEYAQVRPILPYYTTVLRPRNNLTFMSLPYVVLPQSMRCRSFRKLA